MPQYISSYNDNDTGLKASVDRDVSVNVERGDTFHYNMEPMIKGQGKRVQDKGPKIII